ncbi:hypothetical protein GCM10008944_01700 [Cytobacillus oceanisediminis]
MGRGAHWAPARLLSTDVAVMAVGLGSLAMIRGLDYSTGNDAMVRAPLPGTEPALVGIEAAFPLWIWGAAILTGSTTLLGGVLLRRHFPIWLGHVILCAIYAALCVGLTVGYLDRPWLDGIRSGTGLALPALMHYLLWWRMGARPSIGKGADDALAA